MIHLFSTHKTVKTTWLCHWLECLAIGLIGLVWLVAKPAQAVTISQPILELNAKPGDIIEQKVQLYDDSLQGVTVYPWVYNFTEDPSKEGIIQLIYNPVELKPDREWVKFDVNKISLPSAGTLVDFPYRLELPDNAEPGTHLIALTFRTRPPTEKDLTGTTVYVGSNVVTSIFLKVAGEIVDKIEADFQAGIYTNHDSKLTPAELKQYFIPKKFFIKPPVEFLVTVNNEGNTHQKPDGNIRIVNDLFGSNPEKLPVNPENKIILPGTDRTLAVPTFGQGFMFGKYRAKLTLLYGNPLRDYNKEISFWIVPVRELLFALGILILLILLLLLIWYLLNKKRRQDEEERERRLKQEMAKYLQATGQSVPPYLMEEFMSDKKKKKQKK